MHKVYWRHHKSTGLHGLLKVLLPSFNLILKKRYHTNYAMTSNPLYLLLLRPSNSLPFFNYLSILLYHKITVLSAELHLPSYLLISCWLSRFLSLMNWNSWTQQCWLSQKQTQAHTLYTNTRDSRQWACTLKRQWSIPSTQLSAGLFTIERHCLGQRPIRYP